jgi:hypothetical protein
LCADDVPVLRHLYEDHVVPELQFLERLHRLMIAAEATRVLPLTYRDPTRFATMPSMSIQHA